MRPLVAPLRLRSRAGGSHDRKVTWLELFFDLIFVAAVAQVAAPLHEHYSIAGLVRFTPLFALIWWAWTGHTVFCTRFDPDDALQRVLTLVQMFAVAVMAANAKDALDSTESAGFAAAYAAVRLVLVAQYFRARQVPDARALATRYLAGHGIAALLWLASALVPAPGRFWIWGLAFALDLGTPWLAVPHTVAAPPDAAHLPERFGLFTLILLGESVVAVMRGMESQEGWPPGAAIAAFLGMGIAFVIWWWYFDGAAGASEQPVRTRREALRFHLWTYAHFPLALGIVIGGVGVQLIVTSAARAELAAQETMLLATATSLVMAAVTVIGAVSGSGHTRGGTGILAHTAIAVTTLGLAFLGRRGIMTSPVSLVVAIAGLSAAQLAVSLSQRHATLREAAVTSGYGDGDIPSTRRSDEPFKYRSKKAIV
jgi:low temperature requirement protein LtrA